MPRNDPFSGQRLSEQAPAGKIEQRLFTREPPAAPPTPQPSAPSKVVQQGKSPSATDAPSVSPSSVASPKPSPADAQRFDLKEEPLYKASYLFTQDELEALEDLKLELRREYDTKVTKNDLIRSALHLLLEDHAACRTRSYATRKIRKH